MFHPGIFKINKKKKKKRYKEKIDRKRHRENDFPFLLKVVDEKWKLL